jgi:S-formylglutathione hydrolase FrmB
VTKLRAAVVVSVLVFTTLVGVTATSTATLAAAPPTRFRPDAGVSIVSARHPSPRLWRLVVKTRQLQQAVRVNVLLPVGYASTTRRYPVLYLFHGTSGGANDWLSMGQAAATTRPYPLITVMADAGYNSNGGGWFTNWVDQHTKLGRANWETFHIQQLIPFTDANLRTVRTRMGRAIAGLSQGGFGSTSYAARYPDKFVAVASFSGAPDIASNPAAESAATSVISATAVGLDGVEANAFFGSHTDHEINWKGHNPATLVRNMRPLDIELWSGNGRPGPLDTPGTGTPGAASFEAVVHQSTVFFTQAADKIHVPYYFDDYGPGTHSWPYWTRDLKQYLPRLAKVFAEHRRSPATIFYRATAKDWTQWGWTVANHRAAKQAWSSLGQAGPSRFVLRTDATSARVTTPHFYRPGSVHHLHVVGGSGSGTATAGPGGRLRLRIVPKDGVATVTIH